MNKKGYKKVFIDLETTGTDESIHHIWQLSGCIRDEDNEVLEIFNFKFRPFSLDHFEQNAIDICGMTLKELDALTLSAIETYKEFLIILGRYCNKFNRHDKYQLIAYNSKFDERFLRAFFKHFYDDYFGSWFWNPSICVMQNMAMFLIDHRGAVPNFKLETLCKCAELGWDNDKAHDALYDVSKTIELFDYCRNNSRVLGE